MASPTATPTGPKNLDQVKAHVMKTASSKTDFPSTTTPATDGAIRETFTRDYLFGVEAGHLDANGALNDPKQVPTDGYTVSSIAEFEEAIGEVTLVTDVSIRWGRSLSWADPRPGRHC